jgi:hypothetical protein
MHSELEGCPFVYFNFLVTRSCNLSTFCLLEGNWRTRKSAHAFCSLLGLETKRKKKDKHAHRACFRLFRPRSGARVFDMLRAEVGSTVTVTNVLPGWIVSKMTEGKFLDVRDQPAWDPHLRDVSF